MSSGKNGFKLRFSERRLPVAKDKEMKGRYSAMQREALGLFIEKNNVYRNVFVEYGTFGIYVRIRDKLAVLFTDKDAPPDESIVESFLDISNYALMGAMIRHFNLRRGQQCEHLYTIISNNVSSDTKILRCIHCDHEISC